LKWVEVILLLSENIKKPKIGGWPSIMTKFSHKSALWLFWKTFNLWLWPHQKTKFWNWWKKINYLFNNPCNLFSFTNKVEVDTFFIRQRQWSVWVQVLRRGQLWLQFNWNASETFLFKSEKTFDSESNWDILIMQQLKHGLNDSLNFAAGFQLPLLPIDFCF
jgi:hypothetical protein